MKGIVVTVILVNLAMLTGFVSGAEQVPFDNDNGFESIRDHWIPNNGQAPVGSMQRVEGGRSGYCMEVINTDKSRFTLFNNRKVPVGSYNDVIKPSLWVKGKGTFKFVLYFYSPAHKNIYGPAFNDDQAIKVDTAEWRQFEHPFQFKPDNAWINEVAEFLIVLEVLENSSLKFDDFELNIDGGSKITMTAPNASAVVPATNAPAPVTAIKTGIVEKLSLKDVKTVKLTAQVNEQPSAVPESAAAAVTTNGIELKYVFPSPGQDACMVEFAADIPEFNQLEITMDGDNSGHRAFIVLIDAGGESHYFALDNNQGPADCGAVKWSGKKKITVPIAVKNPFGADHFSSRWGGDLNQRIDFPVKVIILGMNDCPDTATGSGKITFETIEFIQK